MNISKEYLAATALVIVSVLKLFGIEMENGVVEGLVFGAVALFIAVKRKVEEKTNIFGARKS